MNSNKDLLATIDLGSNSFRLLIAQMGKDGSIKSIDQIKETVRLAGGLNSDNMLSKESQLSALEVLSRFAERLTNFKREQVRVVGTSTLRVAKNAEEFIIIANKTLGFNIEVISGNEEARLIYIGAAHSIAYSEQKRLIIDIGGGSTEFVMGTGYDPSTMESVTMGCVSFSNRYFDGGELTETNFDNAIFAARGKIQAMEHLFAKHDWKSVIGTSGTAKTLYEVCVANGYSENITLEGLQKLKKSLLKYKQIKNIAINGIKDDRRPVIPGGLSIMIAIMEELHIDNITIADGALREGVMYDMVGRKSPQDLRINTVNEIKSRYLIDNDQAERVSTTAIKLYQDLVDKTNNDDNNLKLMQWATSLYEIGLSISHNDYHRHGAYILANSDLAGFSKPEQSILAELVKSHRGNLSKIIENLKEKHRFKHRVIFMIIAFRLSVIFNRNRQQFTGNAQILITDIAKLNFSLLIDHKWLLQNPLTLHSLNEEIEQWKKVEIKIKLLPQ